MNKSTKINNSAKPLSEISTYQSGVVQSTASRKLNRHVNDFLRPYELTSMQWFIIGTIYDAGSTGITLTALNQKLGTTLPFMTNSINLLESRGIVQKTSDSKDARTKIVAISPNYTETCREIEDYLRQKMRQLLYKDIEPEDLTSYIKVLYIMANL